MDLLNRLELVQAVRRMQTDMEQLQSKCVIV
jgi:hypothetical protein